MSELEIKIKELKNKIDTYNQIKQEKIDRVYHHYIEKYPFWEFSIPIFNTICCQFFLPLNFTNPHLLFINHLLVFSISLMITSNITQHQYEKKLKNIYNTYNTNFLEQQLHMFEKQWEQKKQEVCKKVSQKNEPSIHLNLYSPKSEIQKIRIKIWNN